MNFCDGSGKNKTPQKRQRNSGDRNSLKFQPLKKKQKFLSVFNEHQINNNTNDPNKYDNEFIYHDVDDLEEQIEHKVPQDSEIGDNFIEVEDINSDEDLLGNFPSAPDFDKDAKHLISPTIYDESSYIDTPVRSEKSICIFAKVNGTEISFFLDNHSMLYKFYPYKFMKNDYNKNSLFGKFPHSIMGIRHSSCCRNNQFTPDDYEIPISLQLFDGKKAQVFSTKRAKLFCLDNKLQHGPIIETTATVLSKMGVRVNNKKEFSCLKELSLDSESKKKIVRTNFACVIITYYYDYVINGVEQSFYFEIDLRELKKGKALQFDKEMLKEYVSERECGRELNLFTRDVNNCVCYVSALEIFERCEVKDSTLHSKNTICKVGILSHINPDVFIVMNNDQKNIDFSDTILRSLGKFENDIIKYVVENNESSCSIAVVKSSFCTCGHESEEGLIFAKRSWNLGIPFIASPYTVRFYSCDVSLDFKTGVYIVVYSKEEREIEQREWIKRNKNHTKFNINLSNSLHLDI